MVTADLNPREDGMRFTSEQYGKTMLLKIDEPTTSDVLATPRWIKMDMDEIEEQANAQSAAVWLKTFLSVNHRQINAAFDAALKKMQALGILQMAFPSALKTSSSLLQACAWTSCSSLAFSSLL